LFLKAFMDFCGWTCFSERHSLVENLWFLVPCLHSCRNTCRYGRVWRFRFTCLLLSRLWGVQDPVWEMFSRYATRATLLNRKQKIFQQKRELATLKTFSFVAVMQTTLIPRCKHLYVTHITSRYSAPGELHPWVGNPWSRLSCLHSCRDTCRYGRDSLLLFTRLLIPRFSGNGRSRQKLCIMNASQNCFRGRPQTL
jgi:hypothetical protein